MGAKRKILVVDDSMLNRQVVSKILADRYEIVEAENGLQALDMLREKGSEISLVILDIDMPVMDGFTFLSVHRSNPDISYIPVIVTTKNDDEDNEVKALLAGASDFITKPYRSKVIRHRVDAIIKLCENAAMVNRLEYDRLTGVYSKEFFYKYARQMLDENPNERFDIICSDIKSFKLLNDAYGTKTCNEILINLAEICTETVGESGICGRLGVDMFAMLVKHREDYTQDLFAQLNSKVNSFEIPIAIVVKYGVFIVDDLSLPITQMCDRAILAGMGLKQKYDKLFAYYDGSQLQALLDEQAITNCMETALEKKQFLVYLQPKYNIKNRKIYGAEALVRWAHPEKGFMSPAQFIPLFEKNGFIYKLDRYVWEETCSILRDWLDRGIEAVPVSVNVSRYDFYDPSLPDVFLNLVEKYQLKPNMLHLEITESAYTEDPNQIIEMVRKLRHHGFIIEMDDFGTGYSSLNMLSQLPIDILKLDMKFIQNEGSNSKGRNILSFVISLARWMDLTVNAEGVETEEQVEHLKVMDCNYVQGFYFAKPMPCVEFTDLLCSGDVDKDDPEFRSKYSETSMEISVKENKCPKGNMLIVDDIHVSRKVLRGFFEKQFTIVEAGNGAAALEYVKAHNEEIDIVLLDLVMPFMDGFQLLEALKYDERLRHIPVVVTSQYGEGNEERTIEMRALDYISKPYNEKLVVRRVNNALASAALSRVQG